MMLRRFKIREHERGLRFVDGAFTEVLRPGVTWRFDPLLQERVDVLSVKDPWIRHAELDFIAKSGALGTEATAVDLRDDERALVWIDGRFATVLTPGVHALWTVLHEVVVEVVDAGSTRFAHRELRKLVGRRDVESLLRWFVIPEGSVGLYFEDGRYTDVLEPGVHAAWMNGVRIEVRIVDRREASADVAGQEIMTADNLTVVLGEQGLAERVMKLL